MTVRSPFESPRRQFFYRLPFQTLKLSGNFDSGHTEQAVLASHLERLPVLYDDPVLPSMRSSSLKSVHKGSCPMTLTSSSARLFCFQFPACSRRYLPIVLLLGAVHLGASHSKAQAKPAPDPDVLVLSNGDTLHGKLVRSVYGKVTFHSDPLGDVTLTWDKIKELRANGNFAVIENGSRELSKKEAANIPTGPLKVADKNVSVHPENVPTPTALPVAKTQYIMDQATLQKEIHHRPDVFQGWNGAATAGATTVNATQHQYAFSGGIDLVRVVPTVDWLARRNRTTVDFLGSYGKTRQPSYFIPGTPSTPSLFVPEVVTKTAIYHAGAERDEYFTPRLFALVQVAFDHNFSQNLDLQQIYGGGLGWTAIKTENQELDLKGTIQYARQRFITGESLNLVGSTFSADYVLRQKWVIFTQGLAYIPAYNEPSAYSVNETNTLAFPTYKNISFSLGTLNSYLNNPPAALPPTRRNSFQFTMGLTYAIKSKY
jgi:hypothetical protein